MSLKMLFFSFLLTQQHCNFCCFPNKVALSFWCWNEHKLNLVWPGYKWILSWSKNKAAVKCGWSRTDTWTSPFQDFSELLLYFTNKDLYYKYLAGVSDSFPAHAETLLSWSQSKGQWWHKNMNIKQLCYNLLLLSSRLCQGGNRFTVWCRSFSWARQLCINKGMIVQWQLSLYAFNVRRYNCVCGVLVLGLG